MAGQHNRPEPRENDDGIQQRRQVFTGDSLQEANKTEGQPDAGGALPSLAAAKRIDVNPDKLVEVVACWRVVAI